MANPMRGEAEVGGRTLVVNFNTLCVAEAALGLKVPAILAMLRDREIGFDDLRRLVRSFLVDGGKMTLDQVGDYIGEAGLNAIGEGIKAAMEGFFPPASEEDQDGDPPKAE